MADRISKNGYPQGENHPMAKLLKVDVLYIRSHADIISQKELASMFNVTVSNINYIINGNTWKSLVND
jgi:plasmid maintenance system antidote protein VapI